MANYLRLLPTDLRQDFYRQYLAKELNYLWQQLHCFTMMNTKENILIADSREGAIIALQYAATKGELKLLASMMQYCDNVNEIIDLAAEHGQINILEWIKNTGKLIDSASIDAAIKGNQVATIKWLRSIGVEMSNTILAWQYGHIEIIDYLLEQGEIKLDYIYMFAVAQCRHLATLEWMHHRGFPWARGIAQRAALSDDLELLQFAVQRGCPYEKDHILSFAPALSPQMLQYIQTLP